jgi:serine phosphatase RsbU (regulator of sigma subunit)
MATFRAALRAELRRASAVEDIVPAVDALLLESIDQSRYVTAVYGVLDPATGAFPYANCGQTPPVLVRADGTSLLLDSIGPSRYVTAVYGILELSSGEFAYMNCGHNPPMLLRADGGRALLDRGRPALGMPVGGGHEAGRVRVGPGDILAIYTDGVVEPSAPGGAEFGTDRLEALLRRAAGRPAREIVQAVLRETLEYAGRPAHEDDFTLLVVKRQDVSQHGDRTW